MMDTMQVLTFLFLMLGPFKIIAPFKKITREATPAFARQLAVRAILVSTITVLLASILGEQIITNFGIPLPILAMGGGIILFLVALLNILSQFEPPVTTKEISPAADMRMALNPLAFPAIVTPFGIAAVIVFMSLSPDLQSKLMIVGIVTGIMIINLLMMLLTRFMGNIFFLFLAVLGAILGIVQVALGLKIIYDALISLLQ